MNVNRLMNRRVDLLVRLSTVLALGALSIALPEPHTALATSCAAPGVDVTPRSIVAGTAKGFDGRPVLMTYSFAITGTVIAVTTDEVQGSPTYGATEVLFDIVNAYEVASVGEQLVVRQSDPGWMSGYLFEVGRSYFVPLMARGPMGQLNWSFLCDPIFPMSIEDAVDLPQFAAAELAVAAPVSETEPTFDLLPTGEVSVPPDSAAASGGGSGPLLVGVLAAIAVTALGVGLAMRRRR